MIRYLSNCLANGTNTVKWGIASSAKCLFCNENQTLQLVISSCKTSLNGGRWNWRHNSILINISRILSKIPDVKVYCNVKNTEFLTPAIITGDSERPDIVVIKDKECKVLELMVGFETNILKNSERKKKKYTDLIKRLNKDYDVEYVDLSMGGIGVIGSETIGLQKMFVELGLSSK